VTLKRVLFAVILAASAPLSALAQEAGKVDRQSFMALSDSIAYELGKAWQMGQNCKRDLTSVSPPKAAGLFINYMKEGEVQKTMKNYEDGMKSKESAVCEQAELKAYLPARAAIPPCELHEAGDSVHAALYRTVAQAHRSLTRWEKDWS
jgi:hypothetical protein